MTGLKHIDKLIQKYGINAVGDDSVFMRRRKLTQVDASTYKLPFCFFRQVEALQGGQSLWCYTFNVPDKKQKFASYLVNERREIIDQVYYPRDHRSVRACEKLRKLLAKSLCESHREYELAA